MSSRALGPLVVPDDFWDRSEVREALSGRDFGMLFRLLSRYTGASQTQIAIAVGMTQGQVSTIMAGDRRVSSIEVAERAFDGLTAPDRARVVFGLAPRMVRSDEMTHSSGVSRPRKADTESGSRLLAATEDDVFRRDVLKLGKRVVLGAAVGVEGSRADRFSSIARYLTPSAVLTPPLAPSGIGSLPELTAAVGRANTPTVDRDHLGGSMVRRR